jgi:hypothetical protein
MTTLGVSRQDCPEEYDKQYVPGEMVQRWRARLYMTPKEFVETTGEQLDYQGQTARLGE